jgi:hypothetical protein
MIRAPGRRANTAGAILTFIDRLPAPSAGTRIRNSSKGFGMTVPGSVARRPPSGYNRSMNVRIRVGAASPRPRVLLTR